MSGTECRNAKPKSKTMTHETFRTPTHDEVQEILAEARQLQSRIIRDLARGFGRAVVRAASAVFAGLVHAATLIEEGRRAQLLSNELWRMSDAQLAARGLTRADIAEEVAAVFSTPATAETAPAPVAETVTPVEMAEPAPAAKRPVRRKAETEIREAA